MQSIDKVWRYDFVSMGWMGAFWLCGRDEQGLPETFVSLSLV
jgi:hypothetical protein